MADFETREMPRDDSQEREEAAAEAAMDVAALAADDLPDAAELTFEEKLAELNRTVMRHPLNREILYKTLAFCAEERPLREAEDFIAALPQFERATQNQFYMLMSLVRSYGLDMIERDEDGQPRFARAEGGALRRRGRRSRGRGSRSRARMWATGSSSTTSRPRASWICFILCPERTDTYIELLEFVARRPRAPTGRSRSCSWAGPLLRDGDRRSSSRPCSRRYLWTSSSALALWFGKKVGR